MSEIAFVRVYRNQPSAESVDGIPIVDIQLIKLSTECYTCLACGAQAPMPGICIRCKGQHMMCAKLEALPKGQPIVVDLQLKKSLEEIRARNGGAESPEEDAVLDQMDPVWRELSDVERDLV